MPRNPWWILTIGWPITWGQILTLPSITDHTHQLLTSALRHPSTFQHLGLVPILSSKHRPLFPHIVISHADSLLPNPAVANFVCTLDPLLPCAHLPHFQFDSNSIPNKSPACRTLYLVVLVMQSFEATCWLPKTKTQSNTWTILSTLVQCQLYSTYFSRELLFSETLCWLKIDYVICHPLMT